ncbi:MAG: GIY-YIG nuclease family protein [Patescibacteria group bacterium]|jgi:putative endonuclease
MYTVYIIQNSKNKRYYIGYTKNLKERLGRHNSGKNISTKTSGNWLLVHKEEYQDKASAWKREKQIKNYKGGNAFKKLICNA